MRVDIIHRSMVRPGSTPGGGNPSYCISFTNIYYWDSQDWLPGPITTPTEGLGMHRRLALLVSFLALLLLPAWGRAQQSKTEVITEKDIVYAKGGAVDLMLNLAMPKDGD